MTVSLKKNDVPVYEYVREVADYIDTHGWTTGRMETTYGAVCTLGGIRRVFGVDNTHNWSLWETDEVISEEDRSKFDEVVALVADSVAGTSKYSPEQAVMLWNDKPRFQSEKKVVKTLRKIARRAEKEQGIL